HPAIPDLPHPGHPHPRRPTTVAELPTRLALDHPHPGDLSTPLRAANPHLTRLPARASNERAPTAWRTAPTEATLGASACHQAENRTPDTLTIHVHQQMQDRETPRYIWGDAGPGGYDCSGLTLAAWASVGVTLGHYTGWQWNEGKPVSRANLRPGDLVFWYSDLHHMGMYVGGGWVVHAPHTGD